MELANDSYVVVGGAGFIGSHLVERLLASPKVKQVLVIDNLTVGSLGRLSESATDSRLNFMEIDVSNEPDLHKLFPKDSTVIHLASNADIAKAVTSPSIDFDGGTFLVHRIAEASRKAEVRCVLYASGSGVYGDCGSAIVSEETPLQPISTYGASKLAGESLLRAYAHIYGLRCIAFRFSNVVGGRSTHGVIHDFTYRLSLDPTRLTIWGDGHQKKSYVDVGDAVRAMLISERRAPKTLPFLALNVANNDLVSVHEIAEICIGVSVPRGVSTRLEFTGGSRGWPGDVPIVRMVSEKVRMLGWHPSRDSKEAISAAAAQRVIDLGAPEGTR